MRGVLLIALAGFFSATAVAGECPKIRYEPRQSISITELRQLTNLEKVSGSTAFSVAWFDYEDYPTKDGWSGFALMMAATGDLGETPVVGVLWANVPLGTQNHFEAKVAASGGSGGHAAIDGIVFRSMEAGPGCKPASLTITQLGNAVFADGKRVGEIKN